MRVDKDAEGFHAKVIKAKSPGKLVELLPYLLFELPHQAIEVDRSARQLQTWGSFTVDGEIYPHEGLVEVSLSPHSFRVVMRAGL